MIALDVEATGVDLHHGAKPFFVTTSDEEGNQKWWEWAVDPLTREPKIPVEDLEEIVSTINSADELILQNPKYDATALSRVIPARWKWRWPWDKTRCTLLAGHLLASGIRHDLYSMLLTWCNVDFEKFDKALEIACNTARRRVRSKHPDWRIAKKGEADMPSAKGGKRKKEQGLESESPWKFDSWLPRLLWMMGEGEPEWETVLRDYSNADSLGTVMLYKKQLRELERRGLMKLYQQRLKLPEVISWMEDYGVTYSIPRLKFLQTKYVQQADNHGSVCVGIAKARGFDLELPKGASPNGSLLDFAEAEDGLNLIPLVSPVAGNTLPRILKGATKEERKRITTIRAGRVGFGDNGRMTFNAETIASLITHFEKAAPGQYQHEFLTRLLRKRKRDTALTYLAAYERFGIPFGSYWARLYPSLNSTGSATLRFGSSNPNEQNISKKESECPKCKGEGCKYCGNSGKEFYSLRYAFGPAPGREWWAFDAKNIELRLPAYEANEKELIALFEKPDEPPYYGSNHLLNFHTIYPDLWNEALAKVGFEKVGPYCKKTYASTWYQYCKNGGFAVQYGAIDREGGTADRAFHKPGAHSLLKARFSLLEALNQYWIRYADKHGYVETMPDSSVDPSRGYPLMCTRTEWNKILPTVPLNYHIQGTAMWWMTQAMIRVYEFFKFLNNGGEFAGRKWPGGYYIVLQVHDELDLDVPAGSGERPWEYNLPVMNRVRELMEVGGKHLSVPTPVGREYHPENWSVGVAV